MLLASVSLLVLGKVVHFRQAGICPWALNCFLSVAVIGRHVTSLQLVAEPIQLTFLTKKSLHLTFEVHWYYGLLQTLQFCGIGSHHIEMWDQGCRRSNQMALAELCEGVGRLPCTKSSDSSSALLESWEYCEAVALWTNRLSMFLMWVIFTRLSWKTFALPVTG